MSMPSVASRNAVPRNSGARKIRTDTLTGPENQPACVTDAATGLVDCGNWDVSATWDTTGQTSGIYLAKLTRIDGGVASTAADVSDQLAALASAYTPTLTRVTEES